MHAARIALAAQICLQLGGCDEGPIRGGDGHIKPPASDLRSWEAGAPAPDRGSLLDSGGGLEATAPPPAGGPSKLPTANGPCPELVEGDVTFTAKGGKQRKARIWIGPEAKTKQGPLVFYFHGTGMKPSDATWSVGNANIQAIKSLGGLVVAPYSSGVQYEWYIANGDDREDDALVVDEIVACAIQKVGIDTRRIHATGMSAGGMITCDLALRRASYFASTAPMSGGLSPWNKIPVNADPSNKSAAMIIHGGTSDKWGSELYYPQISKVFGDQLVKNGGFVFTCDHGQGHTVVTGVVDSVWRFFQDHPWNTIPSPYAKGLPASFPSYCKLD